MKYILFVILFNSVTAYQNQPVEWNPWSWKLKTQAQIPVYKNMTDLARVERVLAKKAPLIFSKECENLKRDLVSVGKGEAFLFMGGDCAETFEHFHTDNIKDFYKLMLQIGILQTFITGKKTVKIGRIAGQFAKPRSSETETIGNVTLPSYRGDIINHYAFDEKSRTPIPDRMIDAYHQSVQTLNIIRAFSNGGFSGLRHFKLWNSAHFQGFENKNLTTQIERALSFFSGLGISKNDPILSQTTLYTSHECLLLPYESSLTRKDTLSNRYYDCSAHFLWIGDRTRFLNSSHIEFCRGVHNPIGIKISKTTDPKELVQIIQLLNPTFEFGKIILITRFGKKDLRKYLPPIIKQIQASCQNVIWCCDPMHGNTHLYMDKKTRYVEDITEEILGFFEVLRGHNCIPGGLHLEMTSLPVTECISKSRQNETVVFSNYQTLCDPRLNGDQVFEILNDLLYSDYIV